jgi:uncharacterized iron-regulated membrane protein
MKIVLGLIRTVHAWSGAALSLILIVLGLTGALLVLKADWLRLTVPAARAPADLSPEALGAAAEAIEARYGEHLHHIVFANPDLGIHQVYLHDETYAYAAGSGDIVAEWTGTGRIEAWIYELHHFLLAGESGMRVAGISALLACALALTGLIVWAPLWRATRFRLWPRSARRGELIGAHRNIGVIFAVPVIFFCLTGAAIIFYQTTQSWLVERFPGSAPEEFFPPATSGDVDWPAALAAAQAEFPAAEIRVAIWPESDRGRVRVRMRQPGELTPDGQTTVMISPATGTVLGVIDAQKLGRGYRIDNAIYPLHTAFAGGRAVDLVTFVSGLALAALGVFGLWSFLIKPRGKRRGRNLAPSV